MNSGRLVLHGTGRYLWLSRDINVSIAISPLIFLNRLLQDVSKLNTDLSLDINMDYR